MVMTRIRKGKRTIRRRDNLTAEYGVHVYEPSRHGNIISDLSTNNGTRSTSLPTSAIANGTCSTTSSSTDDTLSMISTPWSTETWMSASDSGTNSSSYVSRTNSEGSSYSSYTVDPKTTTTYGLQSPEVKTVSNLTVTVLGDVLSSPSASRYVQPLMRLENNSSPTFTSWSLETYTSTGLVTSTNQEALRVNYPWSPCTFISDSEVTDYYPSSPTLVSQKGSREDVGSGKYNKKPLLPMNYIVVSKDDNPNLDWILVKRKGIFTKKK